MSGAPTTIAIVGTGYVADLYMPSLATYPGLELIGAWDIDPARLAAFTAHWDAKGASGLDALLWEKPDILLNLTNPHAHAAINSAADTPLPDTSAITSPTWPSSSGK